MELQDWEQRHRAEARQDPIAFVIEAVRPLKPGKALDLACGTGRHALWLAQHGWNATAVDGSPTAIAILRERAGTLPVEAIVADLERREFTIVPESWDLVVISLYLQRDLFEPAKLGVKPGGVVVAIVLLGDAGEPKRHRSLPGELKAYFDGWEILDYVEEHSQARIVARNTSRRS